MAAVTIPHRTTPTRPPRSSVAAPPPTRSDAEVATDASPIETSTYWQRFGHYFLIMAAVFSIVLFFGGLAITVGAGGSVIGGLGVGGMAALWGTPCFAALFAANLATDD